MRVSVLLACWNAERYVAEAVRSVLTQMPAPAEVITVDDGSTDNSAEILKSFVPQIVLLQQPNRGVAAALNFAAAHASGNSLAFIDADDIWVPGKLNAQCSTLAENPELDGVFGHVQAFASPDLSAELQKCIRINTRLEPGFMKSSLLLRRTAFERIGRFDESRRGADFIDWYARAISLGFRWKMLPDLVHLRRIHADNMGRRDRARQHDNYLQTMAQLIARKRASGGVVA